MSSDRSKQFFNRIRAAQTDLVRRDVREDPGLLQLVNDSLLTPLQHAIDLMNNHRGSSVEMVNLLLNEGADPNFRGDSHGPTALHYAVSANELSSDVQRRIVTLLLKHGADPSLTNYSRETPAQMPGVRPDIQQLVAQAGSLRQSFIARGGIAVPHDRPSTPPAIAQPAERTDSALQRAMGAVGAAVQPLVAAAGAGIVSSLGGSPAAVVPQAVASEAHVEQVRSRLVVLLLRMGALVGGGLASPRR